MDEIKFACGSVPVRVAAKVYGRDPSWVRAGIITGWLPIGEATRNGVRITDIKQMDSKYGGSATTFHRSCCMSRRGICGTASVEIDSSLHE